MSELIRNFGIDWRLLLSQAVNFFILLFILKKFAYQPIIAMLKKRREDIEKGIRFTNEAEEKLAKVDVVASERLAETQKRAMSIIKQAEDAAKIKKDEIIGDANKKIEDIVQDSKRMIQEEKAKMGDEVYRGAESLIRSAIAKVLIKMPPHDRDKELIKGALKELKTNLK